MERELVYDFKNAAYDMTNGAISPEERLFVAQTSVIRQIAAKDESCVIMGRCADWVLYSDPTASASSSMPGPTQGSGAPW